MNYLYRLNVCLIWDFYTLWFFAFLLSHIHNRLAGAISQSSVNILLVMKHLVIPQGFLHICALISYIYIHIWKKIYIIARIMFTPKITPHVNIPQVTLLAFNATLVSVHSPVRFYAVTNTPFLILCIHKFFFRFVDLNFEYYIVVKI